MANTPGPAATPLPPYAKPTKTKASWAYVYGPIAGIGIIQSGLSGGIAVLFRYPDWPAILLQQLNLLAIPGVITILLATNRLRWGYIAAVAAPFVFFASTLVSTLITYASFPQLMHTPIWLTIVGSLPAVGPLMRIFLVNNYGGYGLFNFFFVFPVLAQGVLVVGAIVLGRSLKGLKTTI